MNKRAGWALWYRKSPRSASEAEDSPGKPKGASRGPSAGDAVMLETTTGGTLIGSEDLTT